MKQKEQLSMQYRHFVEAIVFQTNNGFIFFMVMYICPVAKMFL